MREVSRLGGKARAEKLSAERRTEIARHAAQARWKSLNVKHAYHVGIDKLEESA